nr:hypothetical protein [Neoroseomonas marina]
MTFVVIEITPRCSNARNLCANDAFDMSGRRRRRSLHGPGPHRNSRQINHVQRSATNSLVFTTEQSCPSPVMATLRAARDDASRSIFCP